jgi:hypothetical protein
LAATVKSQAAGGHPIREWWFGKAGRGGDSLAGGRGGGKAGEGGSQRGGGGTAQLASERGGVSSWKWSGTPRWQLLRFIG